SLSYRPSPPKECRHAIKKRRHHFNIGLHKLTQKPDQNLQLRADIAEHLSERQHDGDDHFDQGPQPLQTREQRLHQGRDQRSHRRHQLRKGRRQIWEQRRQFLRERGDQPSQRRRDRDQRFRQRADQQPRELPDHREQRRQCNQDVRQGGRQEFQRPSFHQGVDPVAQRTYHSCDTRLQLKQNRHQTLNRAGQDRPESLRDPAHRRRQSTDPRQQRGENRGQRGRDRSQPRENAAHRLHALGGLEEVSKAPGELVKGREETAVTGGLPDTDKYRPDVSEDGSQLLEHTDRAFNPRRGLTRPRRLGSPLPEPDRQLIRRNGAALHERQPDDPQFPEPSK